MIRSAKTPKLPDIVEFNPKPSDIWTNHMYLIRRIISKAIRANASELRGTIMDYGCGSRPYEAFFVDCNYVGVDIDVSGHPSDKKLADVYFDGTHLPFSDNHFDGVLASEVIEHVMNLEICLEEIHRVLKPGGKILVTCPFVWPLHEVPYDFARYTPFALEREFSRFGFSVTKVERLGSSIEAVGQMFIIECLPVLIGRLIPTNTLRKILWKLGMGITTGVSRILARLYQGEGNLYLTNLLVAVKEDRSTQGTHP